MQLSGKRLKTAVSDFGHLAGLPFLLILGYASLMDRLKDQEEDLVLLYNRHQNSKGQQGFLI